MKIVSEVWRSDQSGEAVVIIEAQNFSVAAFSHPYNHRIGEIISRPLQIFSATGVSKSKSTKACIRRQKDGLGHEITATLADKSKGLLAVGSFLFQLDESLPGDICDGDFVNLVCNRIDLW